MQAEIITETPPTCVSTANQFAPYNESENTVLTVPWVAECAYIAFVWFDYICMRKNSFREAFHHVPLNFSFTGSPWFFIERDDWRTYPCVNSLNGTHQLLFLLSSLMCWWLGGGVKRGVWRTRKLTTKPIPFDSHQWVLIVLGKTPLCVCVCVLAGLHYTSLCMHEVDYMRIQKER